MKIATCFIASVLCCVTSTHADDLYSIQPTRGLREQVLLNNQPFDARKLAVGFVGDTGKAGAPRAGITVENRDAEKALELKLSWVVKKLDGTPIHEVATQEHEVPAKETRAFHCAAPGNDYAAPLTFHYRAEIGDKTHEGAVPVARANSQALLEDYEQVIHPTSGMARMAAEAAHTGKFGVLAGTPTEEARKAIELLDVLLAAVKEGDAAKCRVVAVQLKPWRMDAWFTRHLDHPKQKPEEKLKRVGDEAQRARERWVQQQVTPIPIQRTLKGYPTVLTAWVRGVKPGARLEVNLSAAWKQDRAHHRWTIPGPVVDWKEWRLVSFPLPVYGSTHQPAAPHELKRNPAAKGPVNYPLRVESLALRGIGSAQVDDLAVLSRRKAADMLTVTARSDKPGNLLLPGDLFRISIRNNSLRRPMKLECHYRVSDLAGQARADETRPLELGPTRSSVIEISTKGWPVGVYTLAAQVRDDGGVLWQVPSKVEGPPSAPRLVVYRPKISQYDPISIADFLRDGHRVELELGKRHEVIPFQWHNSYPEKRDGIEPREGMWMWHDYDAHVARAVAAGKRIIGRLGLTAAWASPVGRYDDMTGNLDWVGSPFILPERSITWKRYVYKVVRRYREHIKEWEVWSEPDDPSFDTTAKEFIQRMLKVACEAARSADPECKLLLGGITKQNLLPFLRDFLHHGGQEYVDAIGLHPVVDPLSPERAFFGEMLQEAARTASRADASGKLCITELGWNVGGGENVTELEQARYLSRALILARFAGLERILLDLHDIQWNEVSSGVLFKRKTGQRFVEYRLGAFAYQQIRRALGESAIPVEEIHLQDRYFHLSRAYLFKKGSGHVLVVWREDGIATMPTLGAGTEDMLGNALADIGNRVTLSPSPIYVSLPDGDLASLRRRLERAHLEFDDVPESQWKKRMSYFADVGDPQDEAGAGYRVSGKSVMVTKSSLYPNRRELRDAGRINHDSETYRIPVKGLGKQDLILRRRVDFSASAKRSQGQVCEVRADGKAVGTWRIPGHDRQRHWRDCFFLVPNRFLAGKSQVDVTLAATGLPFTTFDFAAGPKTPGALYLSDISPLVDSQGWVGSVREDRSFLHSALSIQGEKHEKGLGVHAPSTLVYALSRQFKSFHFRPGIDDVTEGKGSVRFKVLVDGRPVYDSRRIDAFAKIKPQQIDVTGANTLRLVVEDGADGKENDIADWADARLMY